MTMSIRNKHNNWQDTAVFIRVDSSVDIGVGHLMRCLTLAGELRDRGAKVALICRDHPGNSACLIKDQGFTCHLLPVEEGFGRGIDTYAAWVGTSWDKDVADTARIIEGYADANPQQCRLLIVDHYGLDSRWEKEMRSWVARILVVDDLANRLHDCDYLLDQNLYKNMESRYRGLVPDTCQLFLGPAYALIRREFMDARRNMRPRTGKVKKMLIFMGGTDPTKQTMKALAAVALLERSDIIVDVVVGGQNPHKAEIEEKCGTMPNVNFHCQTDQMAELMAAADLAIGAGGTATWERCYMELPTLAIVLAENQNVSIEYLDTIGAVRRLGRKEEICAYAIAAAVNECLKNPSVTIDMSRECKMVGVARYTPMFVGELCDTDSCDKKGR